MQVAQQRLVDGSSRLFSTMKVVPGVCTRSLAFDVARDCGVPEHVLDKAHAFHERLLALAAEQQAMQPPTRHGARQNWGTECSLPSTAGSPGNTNEQEYQFTGFSKTIRPVSHEFSRRLDRDELTVQLLLRRVVAGESSDIGCSNATFDNHMLAHMVANWVGQPLVHHLVGRIKGDSGSVPPPNHSQRPALYVVRYTTNMWYVGETQVIANGSHSGYAKNGACMVSGDCLHRGAMMHCVQFHLLFASSLFWDPSCHVSVGSSKLVIPTWSVWLYFTSGC